VSVLFLNYEQFLGYEKETSLHDGGLKWRTNLSIPSMIAPRRIPITAGTATVRKKVFSSKGEK